MIKRIKYPILWMWGMLMLFNTCLMGQSLEVCGGCTYQTIQQAITASVPGDTVFVHEGIYQESEVKILHPLKLIAKGRAIIDGQAQGSVLYIESEGVEVNGFEIRNVGFSHTQEYAAIHVHESKGFRISNNILRKVFFGILIERSSEGEITDNDISGEARQEFYAGNGIHGWHSSGLTIRDNELSGLRDGIYLEFVHESVVKGNLSMQNLRYGLHFMFSDHDRYEENTFRENGSGVAVMFSKYIVMKGNNFHHNWGSASYGLLLKEISDADIEGNDFYLNTVGIRVDGSNRVTYTSNRLRENGWAIKVAGGCYGNSFTRNAFVNNSFDLAYNSKMNDNTFINNYWSSYTGYDLNRDGIGDVAHRPVKLFSYIVNQYPETVILMRSLFIHLMDFSEKVSPIFTPDNLVDPEPLMKEAL